MYHYVISDGSYSDYEVLGFYSSDKEISEEKFKEYWQEAIKRKSDYYDKGLEVLSKYLKIPKIMEKNCGLGTRVLGEEIYFIGKDKPSTFTINGEKGLSYLCDMVRDAWSQGVGFIVQADKIVFEKELRG